MPRRPRVVTTISNLRRAVGSFHGAGASVALVPTMGFGRSGGFIGLFAPRATPPAVVKRISADVEEILQSPVVLAALKPLTVSAAYQDSETFAKFLADEGAQWRQTLQMLKLAK